MLRDRELSMNHDDRTRKHPISIEIMSNMASPRTQGNVAFSIMLDMRYT